MFLAELGTPKQHPKPRRSQENTKEAKQRANAERKERQRRERDNHTVAMKILSKVMPKIAQFDGALNDPFAADAPSWAVDEAKSTRDGLVKFRDAADATIKSPESECKKSVDDLTHQMKKASESLMALTTALANVSLGSKPVCFGDRVVGGVGGGKREYAAMMVRWGRR